MAKIFWVEDQLHWVNKFKAILENADFADGATSNEVAVYRFVETARQAINHHTSTPDIIILDANMNGNDDAGICLSHLIAKKWRDIPVIYLSEHSGTHIEEKAFELSQAQDFIAKHQQNVEQVVCWRIKALIRQAKLNAPNNLSISHPDNIIQSGQLLIDLTSWNVYWHGIKLMNPANSQRPLTPIPRKILRQLVNASPHPLTTDQMAEKLDLEKLTYANYRQHIKTLRHAFEQAARQASQSSFLTLCKNGRGIVTFGDEGAYCWKK
ncbi:response regulator transcription factor [Aliikangiella maris]|uniref:Response regulator n=2 Tax=Aliikangiella maris TaxID=3162458 RepID=A0ABV2C084_9GAMM